MTANQIEAIKIVTAEIFGAGAKVLLFGSRVDDSRRGGDIALYITDSSWTTISASMQRS